MPLKHLIAAGLALAACLTGCASTLQTRQSPKTVHASVESLLKAQRFTNITHKEDAGAWHVLAVRIDSSRYTEKKFKIEEGPATRTDPIANNGNMTTFEERVDPSHFTSTEHTDTVRYQVDIAVAKSAAPRKVTVSVHASPIPLSNKYREIVWTGGEPISAHEVEESLFHGLEHSL
jgi:hypothetical protein